MEWIKIDATHKVPIKPWCREMEDRAMAPAVDLAMHPVIFRHVALIPKKRLADLLRGHSSTVA